jgi:hypothetical protein
VAGVMMIFTIAGLAGLATWYFGSSSRRVSAPIPAKSKIQQAQSWVSTPNSEVNSVRMEPIHSGKTSEVTSKPDQDVFYAAVAEEIESGNTDKGLWTRLYAECDGDEKKTKVQYIKTRASQLADLDSKKRAAENDAAKKAAILKAAELEALKKNADRDRALEEEQTIQERLAANAAIVRERFSLKEKEALAHLPIVKDGDRYRVNGISYYDLDDAIRYASQLSTGNPWERLATDDDSRKIENLGLKVAATFAFFFALIYGATQYFGSQLSKFDAYTNQALCAAYWSNQNDQHEILAVVAKRGYKSYDEMCPVAPVLPANRDSAISTSKKAAESQPPKEPTFQWEEPATLSGTWRQGRFDNCCFDGKSIQSDYFYLVLHSPITFGKNADLGPLQEHVREVSVHLGIDESPPIQVPVGASVTVQCQRVSFGINGHYPLSAACVEARVASR